jgi:hypothetical protein
MTIGTFRRSLYVGESGVGSPLGTSVPVSQQVRIGRGIERLTVVELIDADNHSA